MSATVDTARLRKTLLDLAEIGPGWAGTPGEEKRRNYVRDRLQEAGLDVRTEEYDYLGADPHATSSCVSSSAGTITSRPVQYTAAATAEGPLIAVGQGREEEFAALEAAGVTLDRAICLVRAFAPFWVVPELARRGAAGVIVHADTADDLIPYYAGRGFPAPLEPPWDGAYAPVPAVTVSRSSGDLLLAAHATGAGHVSISHQTTYTPACSANLAADADGSGERYIALIGHYDTQLEGGVWDNGTGLAVLIELAHLAPTLRSDHCGLRFVAVGGEEQLMWGSHHYAQRHRDELKERCRAVINWDSPSAGYPVKNACWCSDSMRPLCEQAAAEASWPVHVWEGEDVALTDSASFAHIGLPTIWYWQYPPVHPYYHTARDNLDLIDHDRLVAVATVGVHALRLLTNSEQP